METDNEQSSAGQPEQPFPLVIFGEVLYDCFPDGKQVLGGAPFNVAWHLRGLGRNPLFVSAVGKDKEGRKIRKAMEKWGMETRGLQTCKEHSTGKVEVSFDNGDPSYEILKPRAWDAIRDEGNWKATELLYHGTLALRSKQSLEAFEHLSHRSSAQRFLDLNLRPPDYDLKALREWVAGVTWLKLNLAELAELLGEKKVPFESASRYTSRLRTDRGIHNVLLTAGEEGAMLDGQFGEAVISPAPTPEKMADSVGAGDSFSAVAIHGILEGWSSDFLLKHAGNFAARVCGLSGATTQDEEFYQGMNYGG